MQTYYYNLAGGINQSSTKTELGLDTKNIYWSDSQNVEIYQNKGIKRQKGNIEIVSLPIEEPITALHQMKYAKTKKLIITTESGKIYIYNHLIDNLTQLTKTITSKKPCFTNFLNGTLVASDSDAMFFIKNNLTSDIIDCNLKKTNNDVIFSNVISIYKGRVWVASESSLYFSALGRYDDFQSDNDAGYINDFYTDTDDIIALEPYKDYLAIYKKDAVYLLTGNSPDDFAILPFANKGASSSRSIVTVNNKQYFLTKGIFTLEIGSLNQICLGNEITLKIKPEFSNFDSTKMNTAIALHYENKNEIWYFFPYKNDAYFHTIWINDYVNKAWYKRVLPQDITAACLFEDKIFTADKNGKIYQEDIGNTFNGEPISFCWKSPFLSIGNPSVRKSIDEFYFILDETEENNFTFSVYKNYNNENKDDVEIICSNSFENLNWNKEEQELELTDGWNNETEEAIWALDTENIYKAEISEANYSIQLCVEGSEKTQNAAIIGIEFKEIYNED